MNGELIIVGTGIGLAGNMTLETQTIIENSDKVLYVVADEATGELLKSMNNSSESIYSFYDENVDRVDTYHLMADYIMKFVRMGKKTCAAFYGHPGIFVYPAHEAMIMAKDEGYPCEMKAAVSAEDCLFADLGIDPGRVGCQSYEVTDYLVYNRKSDSNSLLILWQVGVIGQVGFRKHFPIEKNIAILVENLTQKYHKNHVVIIYEASVYPVCPPKIIATTIELLDYRQLSPISTLVVPPLESSVANLEMVRMLGIPDGYIKKKSDTPSRYNPLAPSILKYI
ncbi:SAM-dependent methyltransferase [Enterobacter roggenkampii]|nr:SAM-dependent methyltransferase [Enterobacter roggenkampii]